MSPFLKTIILLCGLCTMACTGFEKREAARKAIEAAEARKDSLERELVGTIDEINKNLDVIRENQGLITGGGSGEDLNKRQSILQSISLINSLLEDNKKKIAELSAQAEALGKEKGAIAMIAKQTRARIEKQESEINSLKQELAMAEFKVADLSVKMDEMQVANEVLLSEKNALIEANAQFDKDLNKAFFVYGTYDELRSKEIIEKKGLIGGRKNTLATAFFKNRSYFSELDVREVKTVPIQGKKPKLLSFHPEGSYEIKEMPGEYSNIVILDPQEFWSVTRFLVVQVK
jgi:hypothetical protein